MRHICADCESMGDIVRLGPDTQGDGISHGICRIHELEFYERGGLLTVEEAEEFEKLLPGRIAMHRRRMDAVVRLVQEFRMPIREAIEIIRRATLAVLMFALCGCASMRDFSEAWGQQPRLVPDHVSGGYIIQGHR